MDVSLPISQQDERDTLEGELKFAAEEHERLREQLEGSEASAAELRQEKGVLAIKITSLEEMLASLQSKLAAEK